MRRTYLSVDIDYWDRGDQRMACTRFIRRALRLRVPTLVVLNHDELLADVDRSGCRRVEHVDYHSDVADHPQECCSKGHTDCVSCKELHLDEGTWLSFVRWRKHGELLWRLPTWKCYRNGWGTCHGDRDPFKEPVSGWAQIGMQQGLHRVPWRDVARVGIAISYDYCGNKETYRGVLAKLLGTKTFEEALSVAKLGQLSERGRRLRRAA
jgi:hypothetical protein